jgi:hypothetical protein
MEKPVYNLEEAELKNNKAVYQGRKLDELQDLNIFLYIVYYVLVVITSFIIIISFNMIGSLKFILIVFLIFFPIIIRYTENLVSEQYNFIMSLVYGIPYEKK